MASYDDIRVYFDESRLLRDAAEKAAGIPIVTGFALDLDSLWLLLYDQQYGQLDFSPDPSWSSDHRYDENSAFSAPGGFRPFGYRRRNLFAAVDIWEKLAGEYQSATGRKRLPVVMTIIHRPLQAKSGQPHDDADQLQELVRITQEAGVALRIEERPRARLSLASGGNIAVGTNKSGTLGGVLDDNASVVSYGVTCSHVAQKNDPVYDGGIQIGCVQPIRRR